VLMYIISKIRYDFYRDISFTVLLIAFVLLILVLIFPVPIPGKEDFKRWLDLGFTTIQPSEIAKVALIMYCAWSMERRKKAIYKDWKMMIPYLIVIGLMCALVYMENHVSGTLLILMIGLVMTFLGGVNYKWYLPIIIVGVIGVIVLVTNPDILEKYAGERIVAWLDKDYDPDGARWQTNQSLYAIGSGGLFGLGLGNSRQKHLYMPEPQNDFVFAIVCEELGFIRVVFIILLFVLLVWRGFVIAMRAKDTFSSLLVMGIVFHVGLQTALNIAVVSDLIPNTGIGLPFFSYGGTSLVILLMEMGMVLGVSRYSKIQKT
ncbi:MAG: FtsW/RodA/SpoVE family cell cycle protein, partial [Acutalibacteraceae bacterium]